MLKELKKDKLKIMMFETRDEMGNKAGKISLYWLEIAPKSQLC